MNVLSASYKYRAVHQIWQCYHFFNGISVYKKLLIATLKFITELLKELLKVFGDPPPYSAAWVAVWIDNHKSFIYVS